MPKKKKKTSLTSQEVACLKELGKRIRAAREAKGWTLEEAEERGWPAWQHLQQIETGEKNVTFTTVVRLLTLFNLDPGEMMKGLKLY